MKNTIKKAGGRREEYEALIKEKGPKFVTDKLKDLMRKAKRGDINAIEIILELMYGPIE